MFEILWIEDQDRSKNTPVLVDVGYQKSSNETEKLIWLEKFEQIVTEIYVKWSGVIIIAGDFNINFFKWNTQSKCHYQDNEELQI